MIVPTPDKHPLWIKHPQKKHLALFTGGFIIAFTLSLLAATDLFTQNPFVRKNLIIGTLFLFAGYRTFSLWRTYFLNKRLVSSTTHKRVLT
jgi:hypothetical protein